MDAGVVQGCGKKTPLPPERISLKTQTTERAELYAHILPPGRPIPIEVDPVLVDGNIPGEENIAKAVLRLRLHRDGSPSGMRAKQLRMWLRAATQEERPSLGNWEKVVATIHVVFRGRELVAPCTWQTVVMIPKGGGANCLVDSSFFGSGLRDPISGSLLGGVVPIPEQRLWGH